MAENDDIPFNRDFPLKPGVVERAARRARMLCNNPSPFTFTGTVSYIVGKGKVAIIDPGPDDEAHAKALLDAVRGETVTHILVTHTHRDHSPNTARIKAATGAPVYAEGPHRASRPRFESEKHNPESGADRDFRPDIEVKDGDTIEGSGWALEAVATPGHTANHLAFAWPERKINFVGDHVMGWSTSIVAPPDGSMIDYMASLARLEARPEDLYFSGHGPEIPEGPRYVRFLTRHRQAREASILHRLAKGEADIPTMVRAIYIGLDPRLTDAAGYSVLAHLEDLVARGIVATDGDPVIGGTVSDGLMSLRHSGWAKHGDAEVRTSGSCIRYSPIAHSRHFFTVLAGAFAGAGGFFAGWLGVVGRGVDVLDQLGDPRGVAAEIAVEIARGGADIDARIFAVGPDADRDVFAKSHDQRLRDRLDAAVAARLRRAFVDHAPFALVDQRQRDLIGALRRDLELDGLDIGIGQPLLFGGIEPGIDRGVGAFAGCAAAPAPRSAADRSGRW